MADSNVFINQMLAPAVLISGIGLILLGMNNRFLTITGRVRELNAELRHLANENLTENLFKIRLESLKLQISTMLMRSKLQKTAIFLLYVALTFTILTVFALAADLADVSLIADNLPIIFSIISLIFIFVSVILEGYEMTMALKTVRDDYKTSLELVENPEKDEQEKP